MTENASSYASTNTDSFTLLTKTQAQLKNIYSINLFRSYWDPFWKTKATTSTACLEQLHIGLIHLPHWRAFLITFYTYTNFRWVFFTIFPDSSSWFYFKMSAVLLPCKDTNLKERLLSRKSVKVCMQASLVHLKPVYLQIAESERITSGLSTTLLDQFGLSQQHSAS